MVRRRQGVSWGIHETAPPPPERHWAKKAIVPAIILILALVGGLIVIPHFLNTRHQEDLAAVDALAEKGPVEEAIAKYARLEKDAKGSSVAKSAAAARAKLEPYAAAAREMKSQADALLQKKDYEGALKLYRALAEQYKLSNLASEAQVEDSRCVKLLCDALAAKAAAAAAAKQWIAVKALDEQIIARDADYAGAKAGHQTALDRIAEASGFLEAAQAAEKSSDWPKTLTAYEQALNVQSDAPGGFEGRVRALQHIPPPPGMTLIVPGEFTVGEETGPTGPPLRKLTTNGFYVDVTEVTNLEYAKFVADKGRPPPASWGGKKPPEKILDLPVVCVSWDDAAAYAEWAVKRLPTDAEWERAARGSKGLKYPWGDTFSASSGVFSRGPQPAGRTMTDRSEEGCLDMAGNVCEWVADDAPPAITVPPEHLTPDMAPTKVDYKFVRGASWAGLEHDRSERVAPDNFSLPTADPTRVVLVDWPGVRGIEVAAYAQTEFFLSGTSSGMAVIQIRKWSPELRKVVVASFTLKPDAQIAGEKAISSGTGTDATSAKVQFDTGCRLVRVEDTQGSVRARIVYKDGDGLERVMDLARRADNEMPWLPELPETNPGWKLYKWMLDALSAKSLADEARCAHRMIAPKDARYVNCGFRCAKDAP